MTRLRLQVALLPWAQEAAPLAKNGQPRQAPLKPWLHVCTKEITLQELADQIVLKFAKIYAGLGDLNIRHLETDFGEILDLTDTVGDVFDDRGPSGDNRTSIVRVASFPPDVHSLRTSTRFGYLMPESSARHRKRLLDHSSPNLPNHASVTVPTVETWGSQASSMTVGRVAKRQKRKEVMKPPYLDGFDDSSLRDSWQTAPDEVYTQVPGSQQTQIEVGYDTPTRKTKRFAMELAKRGDMGKEVSYSASFTKEHSEDILSPTAGRGNGFRSQGPGRSQNLGLGARQTFASGDGSDIRRAKAIEGKSAAESLLAKLGTRGKKESSTRRCSRVSPKDSTRLHSTPNVFATPPIAKYSTPQHSTRNMSATLPVAFLTHRANRHSPPVSWSRRKSKSVQSSDSAPSPKTASSASRISSVEVRSFGQSPARSAGTFSLDAVFAKEENYLANEVPALSPRGQQTSRVASLPSISDLSSLHSISDLSSVELGDSDLESDLDSMTSPTILPHTKGYDLRVPLGLENPKELKISEDLGVSISAPSNEENWNLPGFQSPLTPPGTNSNQSVKAAGPGRYQIKQQGFISPVRQPTSDSPVKSPSTSDLTPSTVGPQHKLNGHAGSPIPERFRYPTFSEIKSLPNNPQASKNIVQVFETGTLKYPHPHQNNQVSDEDDKDTTDTESGLSGDSGKGNWGPGMKGLQKRMTIRFPLTMRED